MKKRKRSNCFVFAAYLFVTRGGYIAMRKSRHITGWHWLWSPDLKRWVHYDPMFPKNLPAAMWHKLWYHGRIRRGDDGTQA